MIFSLNYMRALLTVLFSVGLLVGPAAAIADTFPSKSIRLVIPYPPGGSADLMGRLIAAAITGPLGQQVVVENRGGASGNIAAQLVAKAPADGYTLMIGNAPVLTINPHLYKKPGYDPIKDFEPITLVAGVPLFLIVNPRSPFQSVKELVDWAAQNPGKLSYAAGSSGSTTALSMEMFLDAAKVKGVQIAYRGSGPALMGLMSDEVPVMFELMPSAMSFINNHQLNPIAVTTKTRVSAFPNLPTIAESGFPGFEVSSWFGVVAPAGTPKDVITKLNTIISKAVDSPKFKAQLQSLNAVPMTAGPAEFTQLIKSDLAKWGPVVKASGAVVE